MCLILPWNRDLNEKFEASSGLSRPSISQKEEQCHVSMAVLDWAFIYVGYVSPSLPYFLSFPPLQAGEKQASHIYMCIFKLPLLQYSILAAEGHFLGRGAYQKAQRQLVKSSWKIK